MNPICPLCNHHRHSRFHRGCSRILQAIHAVSTEERVKPVWRPHTFKRESYWVRRGP